MRLGRFAHGGQQFVGIYGEGEIRACADGRRFALESVRPLLPVQPSKIVAAGLNYRAHAAAGHRLPERPLLFLKPPSTLIGTGEPIPYPPQSEEVYVEGELGVVIGRRCRTVSAAAALDHVLGYCCANDVTAWDLLQRDGQFGEAKSFDGFTPVGPWLETDLDPRALALRTWVNGVLRQESSTADLLFSVAELIAYVSQIMTLEPGDLLLTGTPPGMGPVQPGDEVRIEIEGVGALCNPVQTRALEEDAA